MISMRSREWHFREQKKAYFLIVLTLTSRLSSPSGLLDIYFHQRNTQEHAEALQLRDAVLRLRRDGVFVAVPLFRVNTDPIGPHPVGQHRLSESGSLKRD